MECICPKCGKFHKRHLPRPPKGKSPIWLKPYQDNPWNKGLKGLPAPYERTEAQLKALGEIGKKALSKYIAEHPEHQKEARAKRTESPQEMTAAMRKASLRPEVRKRATQTHINTMAKNAQPSENTGIERKTKEKLVEMGLNPESQYPFRITVMDFAFPKKRIAIYCDGCYWHNRPNHHSRNDERRRRQDSGINAYLKTCGWHVIRLWEHDINSPDFESLLVSELKRVGLLE